MRLEWLWLRAKPALIDGLFVGINLRPPRALRTWCAIGEKLKANLSFGDQVEQVEKLREADRGTFRALDERIALGAQRGDAEAMAMR